jgi:hypothetical protein
VGGLSARLRGYEAAAFKFPPFRPDENSLKGKCDTTRKEKKGAIEFTRIFSTRIDSTDISKNHQNLTSYSMLDDHRSSDRSRKEARQLAKPLSCRRNGHLFAASPVPPSTTISCSNAWRFKCDQRRYLPSFWTLHEEYTYKTTP